MTTKRLDRLLVTGAAGFIGSNVVRLALEEGREVIGVDNMNDAYDVRLKQWRLERLRREKGFVFENLDISQAQDLDRVVRERRPDALVNLAARAGVRQSVTNPWVYIDTNVTGTLNALEACRRHDIRTMMLASTSSLYGQHNATPFREDANTDRPLSPYAASKKAAEALVATYAHLYGLSTPTCRYFTVYGPAGRPDMSVFRFIRWIAEGETLVLFGDGSQERDFTFVEDIARGTLASLQLDGAPIINLGGDAPASMNDVIRMIEARLERKANIVHRPLHAADVRATWADITQAKQRLGWRPTTSLREGLDLTIQWYLSNRSWARTLETGEA